MVLQTDAGNSLAVRMINRIVWKEVNTGEIFFIDNRKRQ